jgi:hypothetical protein
MGQPMRCEQLETPEVPVQPVKARPPRRSLRAYYRRLLLVTFAVSALAVAAVIGASTLALSDRQAPPLRLSEVAAGRAISVAAPAVSRRVGFVTVSGSLVNRSGSPLERVESVVDLLDAQQHTLGSASAMIDRDRIDPGQPSRFQVELPDKTAATSYRLRFRTLYGTDLR